MYYFTISEFGKLRNVNINSLRYYVKIGILKPDHVDAGTGYRYYSPDQLPILDVILLCLDFGMPMKELKSYISDDNFINNSKLFEVGRQRQIVQNKYIAHVWVICYNGIGRSLGCLRMLGGAKEGKNGI